MRRLCCLLLAVLSVSACEEPPSPRWRPMDPRASLLPPQAWGGSCDDSRPIHIVWRADGRASLKNQDWRLGERMDADTPVFEYVVLLGATEIVLTADGRLPSRHFIEFLVYLAGLPRLPPVALSLSAGQVSAADGPVMRFGVHPPSVAQALNAPTPTFASQETEVVDAALHVDPLGIVTLSLSGESVQAHAVDDPTSEQEIAAANVFWAQVWSHLSSVDRHATLRVQVAGAVNIHYLGALMQAFACRGITHQVINMEGLSVSLQIRCWRPR